MEHTASNIETYISLLPSLLKVFAMFQMRLLHNVDKGKPLNRFFGAYWYRNGNSILILKNMKNSLMLR